MLDYSWLIPASPLLGFILLMVFGRRIGEPFAGWIASIATLFSFIFSVLVFLDLSTFPAEERFHVNKLMSWVDTGSFKVDFGILVDPLAIVMCLFITGIGTLIHIYSIAYMHGDKDFSKFFVYLNLFVASMLVLVLGDNLLLTFLGWEGVGACSYLLISFWFEDKANATAGKKAFITNRVGDFGFMIATFLIFISLGSINYADIFVKSSELSSNVATVVVLLFLLAATGKSAQIPLFVWLPDAMAGPTPVSALIHAATMVTSGVFLLTRLNPVLAVADVWSNGLIAWVGAVTALVAATSAVAQNDIKKVLAYSTISQLGYLFMAVGVGAYIPAIFHMVTHAFFKALLFLGSGSVIHAMHHEQNMLKMGGLRKFLPITSFTFIIGWLAIAGVPPFSGFWSKDEILLSLWNNNQVGGKALWVFGLLTALITAFYMTRQVLLVFYGKPRFKIDDSHPEPKESPSLMTWPLIILSVLAAFGGIINLPFSKSIHYLGDWLEPSLFGNEAHIEVATSMKWILALMAIGVVFSAIAVAGTVYYQKKVSPSRFESPIFAHAWYINDFYSWLFGVVGARIFLAAAWFDAKIIDGFVQLLDRAVVSVGKGFSTLQTGYVRSYALVITLGTLLVGVWMLWRLFI